MTIRLISGREVLPSPKETPDRANLSVHIDKNHTYACVYHSKSKSQVTGLDMVFFRSRKFYGADNVWLSATELHLDADGTYSVKFKAPLSDEELRKLEDHRPPSQLPPDKIK